MLGSWVPTPRVTAWLVQNACGRCWKAAPQADHGVGCATHAPGWLRSHLSAPSSLLPGLTQSLALQGARRRLDPARGSEPPPPTGAQHLLAAPAPEEPWEERQHSSGYSRQGGSPYLPVQKGGDQAEVLRVLHEPAEREERVTVGAGSDPLTAGLPCPARPEQQGQLPEGLWALRKYLSAAQLPTKTGTLNLAQWSWAGWELRCANVHHGVGEGREAGSACSSLCSIPWPPKPVPAAGQGRIRAHLARASAPGKESTRNCHHTPHHGSG